ncbi:MAG TPA: phosphohydrolase [Sediminispirochaeta sp.]|nr:phosphohydrolase [Sediminispirochaeta sp.]
MKIPTKNNKKMELLLVEVDNNVELNTIWEACNIMAVKRLGMSDHGRTHVAIVANLAVKILRLLLDSGITPSIVEDWELENDDAEIVVMMASLMHDLGNSVHRDLHDDMGVSLAMGILPRILEKAYPDPRQRQIMVTETLHAMVAHDTDVAVHTLEAGVVRLADGLDMKKGRARIGFEAGKKDIHSISAMAIEDVRLLKPSPEKPVRVEIVMEDAAGVFQVDYLLKKKIKGSGLERHVEIVAKISHQAGSEHPIETYRIG